MIDEIQLENSARFVDAASQPQIGFGRGGVTRWVIVDHDEGIGGVRDHRLKDFSRVGEGLIDSALANCGDLD